ncbi:MAG: EAL domain-containing protein [Atopobiaceae bacterium]|nr:EAL domain-containing protein [Atopobiaceae bacterium]
MCQSARSKAQSQRANAASDETGEAAWDTCKVFTDLAHALARGYTDLYYVNMDTDEFIEYHTDDNLGVLTEARWGTDFFEGCERDAKLYVHPEDQDAFVKAMNRQFLNKVLGGAKVYDFSYRRIRGGVPLYVNMRITRMEDDKRFIVLAVSDIDELMQQRKMEERLREERIIYARLHALSGNYIAVYVVDPETNAYHEFSATENYVATFAQAKEGTDFFKSVRDASQLYNHPDDQPRFLEAFTKENVLAQIERKGFFTLDYRLIMGGQPLYVELKAAMVEEDEGLRLIVGINDIDVRYRQKKLVKEIAQQKETFNQIAASLAEQYDQLYYIDIATGTYLEISSTNEYKRLKTPATSNDFFAESRRSIRKYVHPEDQQKALALHYKDVMLSNLRDRGSFSMTWRLVVDGKVRHIRHTEILAKDGKHITVCIKNIDKEMRAVLALKANQEKAVTFTQIAESLADHYDFIYYIDCKTCEYAEYSTKKISGKLKVQAEGSDFFAAAWKNADRLVFSEDRERIRLFLDRDRLISQLENRRQLTEDYRMVVEDGRTQYTRMTVTYSSDHSHFIICIENRDADVRKEQEQLAALSMANEMARRDELTHTKNKTAYREMESALQKQIDEGSASFGIVVCDTNDLKVINDTQGHKAGDEYIKASCMLICRVFAHSPVFRIGGDEFAVVLRGQDYANWKDLVSRLRKQVEENVRIGEGPVIASGIAEYQPAMDQSVEDVFNRADTRMYEEKSRLKEEKSIRETYFSKEDDTIDLISDDRRAMLDTLYKAFEMVSEGTYVYLCDMKYDYSRWTKSAVDRYGLPSEYMYGAGDIWENHIHPEDRATYRKGINEVFQGSCAAHDMQYRAQRTTGEYDVCTCRGIVIRDPHGVPDYFVGTIRNHSMQGHVDELTGLRNQYGFFEDLDIHIRRSATISVLLFGIAKFSEINEMYGYHFGNRVLQLYARRVFEMLGTSGHTYRIDGTQFAIISNTLSIAELRERYDSLRSYLHEGFVVNGKNILLDLHCGALRIDEFNIDSQTAYACLDYADTESKIRQQGNMVEFQFGLDEQNHQKLEKLHAIRASIMHGRKGFYLLFQPVVDAQTERLIGAEALLRWRNDRYGVIPPNQFIPILESDPLFPELGEWIIWESLFAAKQLLKLHPSFVVNVNLSYTQLEKPDFVDMVLRILNDLDYPPEHLCFEVTERCRLLNLDLLKNVLVSLKSRGILLALDDFGTGFSSVGILKEIPFNTIKIDRSFVQAIEESNEDRNLVQNIADLASIFGAKVCVEGIETKGMRDILMRYRVSSFQGYYYAKPLPFDEFLAWSGQKS